MTSKAKRSTIALAAVVIAFGGAALALERAAGPAFPSWIAAAYAEEHNGGPGGSGGGHGGGGDHASGGGHVPGEETGGEEAKGHGTRYQHRGHSGGQHAGHGSAHQAEGGRFGGGSGLRGNDQVPEGIGRYGAGVNGLSAADRGRFRYWGGWTLPEPPVPEEPTSVATTNETIPGPGGGPGINVRSTLEGPARCEGITSGMSATQQFSGSNLLRLNEARGMVDPALAASGNIAPPYLMGNLQSELMKPRPDSVLAGTYLGLVAKIPVTPETVERIGSSLCASVGDAQAKEIARVAEQQRAALMAAARANGESARGTAR